MDTVVCRGGLALLRQFVELRDLDASISGDEDLGDGDQPLKEGLVIVVVDMVVMEADVVMG